MEHCVTLVNSCLPPQWFIEFVSSGQADPAVFLSLNKWYPEIHPDLFSRNKSIPWDSTNKFVGFFVIYDPNSLQSSLKNYREFKISYAIIYVKSIYLSYLLVFQCFHCPALVLFFFISCPNSYTDGTKEQCSVELYHKHPSLFLTLRSLTDELFVFVY